MSPTGTEVLTDDECAELRRSRELLRKVHLGHGCVVRDSDPVDRLLATVDALKAELREVSSGRTVPVRIEITPKDIDRLIRERGAAYIEEHAGKCLALEDLAEAAWGVIANAGYGSWNSESPEWRLAAERWRDRYHAIVIDKARP